ncbi:MAG: SBBP repeat-containing protein, partial [Bacteroidia bacterium]
MPFFFKLLCFFSLSLVLAGSLGAAAQGFQGTSSLGFIQNQGQLTDTDGRPTPDILFQANLKGQTIYLRKNGISYVLSHYEEMAAQEANRDKFYSDEDGKPEVNLQLHRVDVDFLGANTESITVGEDAAGPYFNYYFPHCPDGIENVPTFKKIIYKDLYPHIDLVFYFSEEGGVQGLKYDLIVHPGGDINEIRMKYTGAENIFIDGQGQFNAETPLGNITEHAPVAYQNGHEIECNFNLSNRILSFTTENYNLDEELIIDPFVRVWSTFLGGSGSEDGNGVISDTLGNVYVAGRTESTDFPVTTGAFQTTRSGSPCGFISKFDSSGSLQWSTYYGGYHTTEFLDISIFNSSELFVCGYAGDGLPTLNAFQASYSGPATGIGKDGIVIKFNSDGTRSWATYIGGSDRDELNELAIGHSGSVYAAGFSNSTDFPVSSGAYLNAKTGSLHDGVAVKFNNSGGRNWSTYLGVGANTFGGGIAESIDVGKDEQVYIAGGTNNLNLSVTSNAYQSTTLVNRIAFITIMDSTGSRLYGSYFGTDLIWPNSIHITADEFGEYYLSVANDEDTLPVSQNGLLPVSSNGPNIYLIKFSASHSFVWGGYFGKGWFLDLKAKYGKVIATGRITSSLFPVTKHSFQTNFGSATLLAAVLQLDYSGNRHYASYYGGSYTTIGHGIDYNGVAKCIYLTGRTSSNTTSNDFPVTSGAFQTVYSGDGDAFLIKFTECFFPTEIDADTTTIFCRGDSVQLKADTGHSVYYWSNYDTLGQTWAYEEGNYWVRITDSSGCAAFDTVNIKITPDEFYRSPETFHATVDSTSSSEGKILLTWPPDSLENIFVSHYRLYSRHQDSTSFLVLADSIPFTQSTFLHENIN